MDFVIKLVLFATVFHVISSLRFPIYRLGRDLDTSTSGENNHTINMCSRIQGYEEKVVQPYNHTFLERSTSWCFSIPPRCTTYKTVTEKRNRTISVLKTKIVFECCQGYIKIIDDICMAICTEGCVNGHCARPDECECDPGWQGINCTKYCELGWYGIGCDIPCLCKNGAICDKVNGKCYCTPGYTGEYCESTCPEQSFGIDCENQCDCMNAGVCDPADGWCECTPGYDGRHCEKQCTPGTFGKNCSGACICNEQKTELCNPINGKCQCTPGWKGDRCNKPCELGNWGRHCQNKCDCGLSDTCHHVSGACSCPPGWHGLKCEEKCPAGFFEKDCKMKCPDCLHESGHCHHETGWCNCPPGTSGRLCDLECPIGKYGTNCTGFCLCINNSTCDSMTGNCTCAPGWTGMDCSLPCKEGSFGPYCSFECNCSNNAICDSVDGTCPCEEESDDGMCPEGPSYQKSENVSFPVEIIAWLSVFVVIVLFLIFVCYFITKKPYVSDMYRFIRVRIQGKRSFRNSKLDKVASSTTDVIQEDDSSIITRKQFTNLTYETSCTLEKSDGKPSATGTPTNGTVVKEHALQQKDSFDEVDFSIPECHLSSPLKTPNIEICFESDFPVVDTVSTPVIKYSCSDRAFFFNPVGSNSQDHSIYADMHYVSGHRYENIGESSEIKGSSN